MQVVMKDLRAATKRAKGLPFQLPDRIELSVEATEEPELLIRMDWPELVETKVAEGWYKDQLPAILDGNLKLKPIKWMVYDSIEMSRKQTALEFWARFETDRLDLAVTRGDGNDRRLVDDDPTATHEDQHVGRPEIDTELFRQAGSRIQNR